MKFLLPMGVTLLLGAAACVSPAMAQTVPLSDPVDAAPDPEALFTSPDPHLNANKQVALKILKELLEADQWDRASLYIADDYIQHNPFAASGLRAVIHYFVDVEKRPAKPVAAKLTFPVVAVQAEGDFVTVLSVRELPLPADPSKTYTTTWFDTWRFRDGKAVEHWDPAALPSAPGNMRSHEP